MSTQNRCQRAWKSRNRTLQVAQQFSSYGSAYQDFGLALGVAAIRCINRTTSIQRATNPIKKLDHYLFTSAPTVKAANSTSPRRNHHGHASPFWTVFASCQSFRIMTTEKPNANMTAWVLDNHQHLRAASLSAKVYIRRAVPVNRWLSRLGNASARKPSVDRGVHPRHFR
jgi:hypothetical protein